MTIIVTGNIGCGKSTVVKQLHAQLPDHEVHNVDHMVADLYLDPMFQVFLKKTFGVIEKAKVSDIVFKDAKLRAKLERESMMYLNNRIYQVLRKDNAILEFPLFFEAGGLIKYATRDIKVVTVMCSAETQIKRVMARDNASLEKVKSIMANQLSNTLKAGMAHHVIDTDKPTDVQVTALVKTLKLEYAYAMARRLKGRALNFFCGYSPAIAEALWGKLLKAYTEPHRAYHTILHLQAMFHQFDECVREGLIHNPRAVELSIWWHDYVYHTDERYADNEMESARRMYEELCANTPEFVETSMWASEVMTAAEMIISTKGHEVKSPYLTGNPVRLSDAQYFLDIDLSILGKSPEVVEEFDNNIQYEFKQYSKKDFANGRVQAMESFMRRDRVYYTDKFYKAMEAQARVNLNDIIQKWSKV